jgi:hypothetical protein
MNRGMLAKMVLKRVRLRPPARCFGESGSELPQLDDVWIIRGASREKLELLNSRTDHSVPLGTDHVREYLSDKSGKADGYLKLKSQIFLQQADVSVEPLDDRGKLLHWPAKQTPLFMEDLDDAIRLASGVVIEGLSPLFEHRYGGSIGIGVSAFTAYLKGERRSVSYNSGSIVGLAPDTTYYIYATDPVRRGGPVIYTATPIRYKAVVGNDTIYIGRLRTSL